MSGFTGTLNYTCQLDFATQWWRAGANGSTVNLSNASVVLGIGNVTSPNAVNDNFGFTDGITGATMEIGALSGNGVFQSSYNNSGPNTLVVGALNTSTIFSGELAGGNAGTNMALTKVGTGTLTLSGTSPYAGATAINGGTLNLTGLLSGTSAITVNSGGTLAGTGTSSGPVTVAGGGAIAPENAGTGTLTISGLLTLNNGSVLNMQLGGTATSDQITLAGALAASGTTTVNLTALSGFGAGTYPLITDSATINAANFTVGTCPSGYGAVLSASSGTLSVTIVTPPGAPTGVTATGRNGVVALSWSAATGATSYIVQRSTSSGGLYITIATGVTGTSYTDYGAPEGTTYYYIVTAVNAAGDTASGPAVATPHAPATINKANNTTNFNLAGSWSGGILPYSMDIVQWTGLTGANSIVLGSNPGYAGIIVATTGGAVSIGAGNTLSLGNSGINMSAATQNLTVGCGLTIGPGNQVWNVASGLTLTLNTGAFTRYAGATLDIQGSGTVTASMTGFSNDSSENGGILGPWATIGTGANTRYADALEREYRRLHQLGDIAGRIDLEFRNRDYQLGVKWHTDHRQLRKPPDA